MNYSGVINYYNGDVGKYFGFITRDATQESIFFHLSRQVSYYCDGDDNPVMCAGRVEPIKGMRVVFKIEDSPKGPRATYWGTEESYQKALADCLNRPTLRLRSRKGRIQKSRLWEKPIYKTLWEGQNVKDLTRLYPKKYYAIQEKEDRGISLEYHDGEGWRSVDVDPRLH